MSSPNETVTETGVENVDENKDREDVLTAWGVKQDQPNLDQNSSTSAKENLNSLQLESITDSMPPDSLAERELSKIDGNTFEGEKKRPNCELVPTEPLPFSPSKVGNQQPSSSLTTSNAITQSQRDSLYPNPPSPEGMDVRSYNSHRPSVSAEELETSIKGLVNTLQCQVCLETVQKSPIFQCPERHLLCQECNKRSKQCPKCGKTLENERNTTAEELADKMKVINDSENLIQVHEEMLSQQIDINIPEYQTIKQGWNKVLSYKIDISILENGQMSSKEYCATRTHDNIASLHAFLLHEYRNNGIIVPPPPPKMVPKAPAFLIDRKKIESNGSDNGNKELSDIEDITLKRRCSAMTRYLKRLAKHPVICRNKVFLSFIQEKELPNQLKVPITNTWENVLEMLNVLRSRIAFKEIDPWYQTKSAQLEEMDANLRKLRKCLKSMSDLKVKSFAISTEFRKNTIGLFSGRLFKERDPGNVINQGIECHKLVSAIHQDQSSADDLIEQLSFDYLLLVESAQDILTRRRLLQHRVQKKRIKLNEKNKGEDHLVEEKLDIQDDVKDLNGSTSKVFSPEKELQDLEIKFETMSQVIRKELEHFDSMMVEEFQKEFSAYNSNYFNLIDRSRADTSLSMIKEPGMVFQNNN